MVKGRCTHCDVVLRAEWKRPERKSHGGPHSFRGDPYKSTIPHTEAECTRNLLKQLVKKTR